MAWKVHLYIILMDSVVIDILSGRFKARTVKTYFTSTLGPLQDRSLAKTKWNKKVQLRTWVEGVQELGQVYNSEHILDASSVKFKTIVAKDKAIGMGELYKEYVWNGPSVW